MRKIFSSFQKVNRSKIVFITLSTLVLVWFFGCVTPKPPPLSEMYRWNLSDFTDDDLKSFLDRASRGEHNRREFWVPMMKKLIEAKGAGQLQDLWVPMKHLKDAGNYFQATDDFKSQESGVYLYYWQLYSNLDKRKELYGVGGNLNKKNEKVDRSNLRDYLPMLFDRHKYDAGEQYKQFSKMYKLVKMHDPELIDEVFSDPFSPAKK